MVDLANRQIMGILNVTPDSHSDGGEYIHPDVAIQHAYEMLDQGATIIDVGGESTNPWSQPISPSEEWRRISPVLGALVPEFPGQISIDTRHPEIIEKAAKLGEVIVNDVTTFYDENMIRVAAATGSICVVSHLPFWAHGDIQRVHASRDRLMDSIEDVRSELMMRYVEMVEARIDPARIVLDPGIGFGKTMKLNWELLTFPELVPGIPVLISVSRKRVLATSPKTGKDLKFHDDEERDKYKRDKRVNLEASRIALEHGARILRVHDVAWYKKQIAEFN